MAKGGIFCVEGQWHRNLNEQGSVLPTLDLLQRLGVTRYIHKDVATPEELFYFLDRWLLQQYSDYSVGFFAMHGEASALCLTDWTNVALDSVAEKMAGKCQKKRFYFGSCSVMRGSEAKLTNFLAETGADFMCGYTKDVDWIESAAFETALLNVLASGKNIDAVEKRFSTPRWAPLAAYLGFRIVYANGREEWSPRTTDVPRQHPARHMSGA